MDDGTRAVLGVRIHSLDNTVALAVQLSVDSKVDRLAEVMEDMRRVGMG